MDTIENVKKRASEQFNVAVSEICDAGTDSLSFFGPLYTKEGGLSLQQDPEEFGALLVFLNSLSDRSSYLEIGSASGGTAVIMHRWTGFEEMYSIDDGQHPRYVELPENFKDLPMEHVRMDSHGPEARHFLDGLQFDVVFIDGDHSEAGVWQDVELVREHVRPGALIILHDVVVMDGCKKAWERGAREGIWVPIAEYIGRGVPGTLGTPLGIGVGFVL